MYHTDEYVFQNVRDEWSMPSMAQSRELIQFGLNHCLLSHFDKLRGHALISPLNYHCCWYIGNDSGDVWQNKQQDFAFKRYMHLHDCCVGTHIFTVWFKQPLLVFSTLKSQTALLVSSGTSYFRNDTLENDLYSPMFFGASKYDAWAETETKSKIHVRVTHYCPPHPI